MSLRIVLCIVLAAASIAVTRPQPCWAQNPAPAPATSAPPASAPKPDAPPATPPATPPAAQAPAAQSPAATAEPNDAFGEDLTLTAKPIIYLKGTGTWDKAFETVSDAFKKLKAFMDKQGLKPNGSMMTIFTSTDDAGFDFQASVPLAEAPKNLPRGDIAAGNSPEGRALKFVHRGSYDGLDNTYEAITNHLDEKRLESKDMFIEEYVTDPLTTSDDRLIVNVYVLVK